MNRKPDPIEKIGAALDLDGDPDTLRRFYAEWADSYDRDVDSEYVGRTLIVTLLADFLDGESGPLANDRSSLQIADVGCGTGLVGKALAERGFKTIDGMDLSAEMIAMAARLDLYRELHPDVDINRALPAKWKQRYDIAICCGVFTPGHVAPESVHWLFEMVRPGGLVVLSTRTLYCDQSGFRAVCQQAEENRRVTLKACHENAPYTVDGDAHYWIFEVR